MTPNEWAGLAVAATTLVAALAMTVRHLVKYYLSELKQNGGSSLRDSVDRLERQVEEIYSILINRSKP
jgi:C4-dicarboxylate-specific signal transduction histidine kinase